MADKKKWIQGAVQKMNQHGTVGSFTAAAKSHHMGTEAYAHKVVDDPNASTKMKRKAQFAINVHK